MKKFDSTMMQEKCVEVSELLKSLAHPQRLMITCYLSEGEKTVGELQELCDISQSQLSQFLGRLYREGIVNSRREGQFSYYSIKSKDVLKMLESMQKIFC